MRLVFVVIIGLILLAGQNVLGQKQNAAGQDNNPTLNDEEAKLLNDYFAGQRSTFDFKDKKVVFVSGSTGKTYITKQAYFADIKKWNETNSRITTSLVILTENEKNQSGNYDAIVTAWVKVLTPKRRKIIVRELKDK